MIKKFKIFEKIEWYQDGEFIEDDSPEKTESPIAEAFKNFLKDNDALDKYIRNINTRILNKNYPFTKMVELTENNFDDLFVIIENKRSIIDNSLNWSSTPEGHDYWSNLNKMWKNNIYPRL